MRRHPLRAALAAALLPLVVPISAVGATTSATTARAADVVPVAVGTYNIRAGVSPETFASAVAAFSPRVSVAGLQEVSSKAKEAVLASLVGFDYYRPARYFGEQQPVLWRSSDFAFDPTRWDSARSVQIADRTYIGNELASRSTSIKAQYATVVRLTHRATGQRISVINVHLVPGAVVNGQPYPGRPRLFDLFVTEVANVITLTKTERDTWGRPFVLGDFNVGWVADERHRTRRLPFRKFTKISMPSMWATERPASRGTHSKSLIDQVYTTGRATRARVQFDIGQSDHWPAIAEYAFAPPTS